MLINFTIFDYFIITIISLSTIFALFKGFIKSCLTFAAFILSFIIAYILFPYVLIILKKYFNNYFILNIGGGILSYIFSSIILAIITNRLLRITENVRGGAVDSSLGLAFGLTRGCIISCIIFIIIVSSARLLISDSSDNSFMKSIKESKSFVLLTHGSILLVDLLPSSLNTKLLSLIHKNLKILQETSKSINELSKILPIEVLSHIDSKNLNQLMDKNISVQEKEKIVHTILNHYNEDNKNNSKMTSEQLKQILLNYIKEHNKKPDGYNSKDNNELNRLIKVLE